MGNMYYIQDNIDLREEFEYLKDKFSMQVLLIRNNNNTRCKCYDPLHRDGNRKCKICGGSGKISSIEKIDIIYQNVSKSDNLKLTEVGLSITNTLNFYIDRKVFPRVQDQILIVGFDNKGLPVDIKKSCTVVSVQEIRGDKGRNELFQVYAKYSPNKIKIDQKRLNSIPLEHKKKIADGKRYIWPQQ